MNTQEEGGGGREKNVLAYIARVKHYIQLHNYIVIIYAGETVTQMRHLFFSSTNASTTQLSEDSSTVVVAVVPPLPSPGHSASRNLSNRQIVPAAVAVSPEQCDPT